MNSENSVKHLGQTSLFCVVKSDLGDEWDVAFISTHWNNRERHFISEADRLINDTRTYWIGGVFWISIRRDGTRHYNDYYAGDVNLTRLEDYGGTVGEKQELYLSFYKINNFVGDCGRIDFPA